jgi:hypothetical protein
MQPPYLDHCRILDVDVLRRCGFLQPGHTADWQWPPIGHMPRSAVTVSAQPSPQRALARESSEAEAVRHEHQVMLHHQLRTGEQITQYVHLDAVPCKPTRGERWFWRCPTCDRRCSRLYSDGDQRFACTECIGYRYNVRLERPWRCRIRAAMQLILLQRGEPADGRLIPRSVRSCRDPRRRRNRERWHRAAAAVALEMLSSEDE